MALHCFTWLCTLFVCVAYVWSMPTKCGLQRVLVEDCHNMLENVGGRFPMQCLDDYVNVQFPEAAFDFSNSKQTDAFKKSVYLTLTSIFEVFDKGTVPEKWNDLDNFVNILDRQIEEAQCVMSKTQASQDDFSRRETALKAYFDRIASVLKEKDYQYCGWEFVRNEVLKTLQFILQKKLDGMDWSIRD